MFTRDNIAKTSPKMFYFRHFLYKILKPFIKPMSPETAFKFHYTGLALYVLVASNAAAFAYYYSKKVDQMGLEEEEELGHMDRCR